jgi:hypothetical protein
MTREGPMATVKTRHVTGKMVFQGAVFTIKVHNML